MMCWLNSSRFPNHVFIFSARLRVCAIFDLGGEGGGEKGDEQKCRREVLHVEHEL